MTEADLAAVRERLADSRLRVDVVDTPDSGRVVVKRQRPSRGPWRGHAVDLLARSIGLDILRAVPAPGGASAQATELRRLAWLDGLGLRVPRVLHVEAAFFVVGHLAGSSLVLAIEAGGAAGFAAWQSGLAALVDVHSRGTCLSQAFARNFLVTPTGLAMIDFEDDPLEAMTLDEAQARDWLAYLHSTAWLLDRDADEVRSVLGERLAREQAAVRGALARAGRRLAVFRHLPRSRRPWGREVVGLQALGKLFGGGPVAPAKMHA
jgi:hypothetical protein